jgi:putative ubiquitin-RnfH superfamily antitoxin RatB of RatAB toxin-antitoxin module
MTIRVEVVYALPQRQWVIALELPARATVRDALAAATVQGLPSEADQRTAIGVWGRPAGLDRPLRDGDRVEIYRELHTDPKTARRKRAARPGRA